MKHERVIVKTVFIIVLVFAQARLEAQQYDCTFKAPSVNIDFGTGKSIPGLNVSALPRYRQVFSTCPPDGHYSLVSHTSECFNGDWHTFNEDHTLNDNDGKMMLVNASVTGGEFFNFTINNLSGNTTYQLAAWLVNVCKIAGGCPPLPPNIIIRLITTSGKKIAEFKTGLLSQRGSPQWKKYFGFFTTPPDVTTLELTMEDITIGGCGNDFALDDITIRECIKPIPDTKPKPEPIAKQLVKRQPPVTKPVIKKTPVKPPTAKKNTSVIIEKKPETNAPVISAPMIKNKAGAIVLPQPISTRENPIIKEIETVAGEIIIDLYDNGEIDGDTVSIYHNNILIVSRAGLAEKPISFRINVDAMQPHHELIMVANNLGSIPPNTSLMIVTANDKRVEVFISSSEEKNAKVVINLKE